MKAELQQLIALQNLDTTIRKLEKDQEAIPERRAAIEGEFDQRAFEIRALENRRDEAKHSRAKLEVEVVEQRGRAERAERNLMSSKKPDEYTAAIREADAARKQISALETQILEQMESLDQAQAALTERADEIASLIAAEPIGEDAPSETIGRLVREERLSRGFTLAELSGSSGIAVPNLSRLESGRVTPRLETLERVAEALIRALQA